MTKTDEVLEYLEKEQELTDTLISLIEKGLIEPVVDDTGLILGYKATDKGIETAKLELGYEPIH